MCVSVCVCVCLYLLLWHRQIPTPIAHTTHHPVYVFEREPSEMRAWLMLYITAPRMRKVTHCAVLLAGPHHHQASPSIAAAVWEKSRFQSSFYQTELEIQANRAQNVQEKHISSCLWDLLQSHSRRKSRVSTPSTYRPPTLPPSPLCVCVCISPILFPLLSLRRHTHETRRQGPFSFDTSVPHPSRRRVFFFNLPTTNL